MVPYLNIPCTGKLYKFVLMLLIINLLFFTESSIGVIAPPPPAPPASPVPPDCSIIVDPDDVGSTDVKDSDGTAYSGFLGDTLSLNGVNLFIGDTATGELLIDGGAYLENELASLGHIDGSVGYVTVTGESSSWINNNYLYVTNGELTISDGAYVESFGGSIGRADWGTGSVLVTGEDSTWSVGTDSLEIGASGVGTLEITNGGCVMSVDTYVATAPGQTGEVVVSGLDSTLFNTNDLYIGYSGVGTLEITNGAYVIIQNDCYIAETTGSTGEVIVDGTDTNLTASTLRVDSDLFVADSGDGTLTISDGGLVLSENTFIANNAGSTAVVTVAGINADGCISTFNTNADLYVGNNGDATLNISDGGFALADTAYIAYATDSTADLIVTGIAEDGDASAFVCSSDLYVGYDGQGTLTISDGGQVISGDSIYAGACEGSTGVITVTGTDTQMIASGAVFVGSEGDGTIEILNGATVISEDVYLGDYETGTAYARISGQNSTWNLGATGLDIGYDGDATMIIEDGASLTCDCFSVAYESTSDSSLTITGPGSSLTSSAEFYFGNAGIATMTISDGASLTNSYALVSEEANAESEIDYIQVTGTNSIWTNTDNLYLGGNDTIAGGNVILKVSDNAFVQADYVKLWDTATLCGDGGTIKIYDEDTSSVGALTCYGTISPGSSYDGYDSIGTLTIDGKLNMENGSDYYVDYDSTHADKIQVTGIANITTGTTITPHALEPITDDFSYEIFTADGGFDYKLGTGEATITVDDTAIIDYELDFDYGTNAITMSASFTDMVEAAAPPNKNIASTLQKVFDAGDLSDIQTEIQNLQNDSYNQALSGLSGQKAVQTTETIYAGTNKFMNNASSRMKTARLEDGRNSYLAASESDKSCTTFIDADSSNQMLLGNINNTGWSFWNEAYTVFGDRETHGYTNGYNYEVYGTSFGLDYRFSSNWIAGLTFGYSDSDIDFAGTPDLTDIDATYFGLYSSYEAMDWYFDSILTFANLSYNSKRYVEVGALTEKIKSDYDGNQITGYFEFGKNIPINDVLVQPLAGFQFSYLKQEGYTEKGGSAALRYDAMSTESYKTNLGFKLTKKIDHWKLPTTLELRARWNHEFGDAAASTSAAFASSPASTFTVADEKQSRDSAQLGFSLDTSVAHNTDIYFDYDTVLNSDNTSHRFALGFSHKF